MLNISISTPTANNVKFSLLCSIILRSGWYWLWLWADCHCSYISIFMRKWLLSLIQDLRVIILLLLLLLFLLSWVHNSWRSRLLLVWIINSFIALLINCILWIIWLWGLRLLLYYSSTQVAAFLLEWSGYLLLAAGSSSLFALIGRRTLFCVSLWRLWGWLMISCWWTIDDRIW